MMRALSFRQAMRCETAKHPTCRCRCGGALHGSRRGSEPDEDPDREFFEQLPEDDPHHLPDQEEKKRRAKKRKDQTQKPLFDYREHYPE